MCARVGGILAPLISLLEVYHSAIPMVLYGTIPLTGVFLCFLLPETLNVELQDHTEQRSVHIRWFYVLGVCVGVCWLIHFFYFRIEEDGSFDGGLQENTSMGSTKL